MTVVDALILAGGMGRRARAYLGDTPKFLAPLDDDTVVADHLLDNLQRIGVRRVLISLGHGAQQIYRHLREYQPAQLTLCYGLDPAPGAGTVAAVRHLIQAFPPSDPLLICNGDTLWAGIDLSTAVALEVPLLKGESPQGEHSGLWLAGTAALANLNRTHYDKIEDAWLDQETGTFPVPRFVDVGTWAGYRRARSGEW